MNAGTVEIVKAVTLTVGAPIAVFSANWAYRAKHGYSQSAAADFILAILIFDITVVLAAHDFEPFLRSRQLLPIIQYWHFLIGFLSCLIWLMIGKWGEPRLASYYDEGKPGNFPFITFSLCWMSIFALIAAHMLFFLLKV